jgi:hypothetical protein
VAEIEIDTILEVFIEVNHYHVKDMHIHCDEGADTMYVNFGAPIPADDSELRANNILYRYREGDLVGVTVTHFSSR